MKRDAIFAVWAPEGAVWSPWVKPVLFAHMDPEIEASAMPPFPPVQHWREILDHAVAVPHGEAPYRSVASPRDVAVVVDLPGASSVEAGLDLADLGFRPVPLYNAVPGPWASAVDWRQGSEHSRSSNSLVDVIPIVRALATGASALTGRRLPLDAPPAFLLDANRGPSLSTWAESSGRFDNRSMCSTTDFPSAEVLLRSGVRRIVLTQASGSSAASDVASTLGTWKKGGLDIQLHRLDRGGLEHFKVGSSLARFVVQLFRRATLRPHPLGGFGATIPKPSAG
jgi:hypothetical protein